MKLIKRVGIAVLSLCLLASMSVSAFAAENTTLRDQICELCCQQSAMYGVELSDDEIEILLQEIENCAIKFADDNQCTIDEAYAALLNEMESETPTYNNIDANVNMNTGISVCSKGDDGTVQLPESKTGNIFFCDSDTTRNHVGLYTASDRIIEAMPDYGVHEVAITDSTAKQKPTGESHDQSCILSVKNATDADKTDAADWAKKQVGKKYQTNFLNNKENTTEDNKTFNCSELVYKAYRYGTDSKIDLDGNGGSSVYPNNIYNSDNVSYVKSF